MSGLPMKAASTSAACRTVASNSSSLLRTRAVVNQAYVSGNSASSCGESDVSVAPPQAHHATGADANGHQRNSSSKAQPASTSNASTKAVNQSTGSASRSVSRSRKNLATPINTDLHTQPAPNENHQSASRGNSNAATARSISGRQRDVGASSSAASRDASANTSGNLSTKVRPVAGAVIDSTNARSSSSSGVGSASSGRNAVDYDYFKKIYTEWVNHHLLKIANTNPGIAPLAIADLERDLKDGIVLARIIELIANQKLPRLAVKPRNTAEMVGNLTTCLEYVESYLKIPVADITAACIFEGDLKSILRLLFALSQFKKQQIQQQKAATIAAASSNRNSRATSSSDSHSFANASGKKSSFCTASGNSVASCDTQAISTVPKLDCQLSSLTPSRSSSSTISSCATGGSISNGTQSIASASSGVHSKTTSFTSSNTTSIHSDDSLLSDANNNNSSSLIVNTPLQHGHGSSSRPPAAVHGQHAGIASARQQLAAINAGSSNAMESADVASSAARPIVENQPHRGAIIVKPTLQGSNTGTMPSSSSSRSSTQPPSNNGTLNRQRNAKAKHSQSQSLSVGAHSHGNPQSLQVSTTSSRSSRSSSRSTSPSASVSSNNLRESGLSSTLNRRRGSKPTAGRVSSPTSSRLPTKTTFGSSNHSTPLNGSMTDSTSMSINGRSNASAHVTKPNSKTRSTPAAAAATKSAVNGSHTLNAKPARSSASSGIPVASGPKKSTSLHTMQTDVQGNTVEELLRGEQSEPHPDQIQRCDSVEKDSIDPKLVTFARKAPRASAPTLRQSSSHYANFCSISNQSETNSTTVAQSEAVVQNVSGANSSPPKPTTTTSSTQSDKSFLKREARRERQRSAERIAAAVAAAAATVTVPDAVQLSNTCPVVAQNSEKLAVPSQTISQKEEKTNFEAANTFSTDVFGSGRSYEPMSFNKVMVTSTDSIDDDESFLDYNNGALRSTKSPYSHLRVLSNNLVSNAGAGTAAVTINGQTIPNLRLNLTRIYADRKRLNTIEEQEPRERAATATAETDSCVSDVESSIVANGYTSDGDLLKPLAERQRAPGALQSYAQSGYNSDYSGYASEGGLSWSGNHRKNLALTSDASKARSDAIDAAEARARAFSKYLKADGNLNVTQLVQELRNCDIRGDASMTSSVRGLKDAFRERGKRPDGCEIDSYDETSSWSSEDCLEAAEREKAARLASNSVLVNQAHNSVANWQSSCTPLNGAMPSNRLSLNLQKAEAECIQKLSVSSIAAESSSDANAEANDSRLGGVLSPSSARPSRLSLPTFTNLNGSSMSSVHNQASITASQLSLSSVNGGGAILSASVCKSGLDNAESHSTCSNGSTGNTSGQQVQQDVEVRRLRRDLEHAYDKVTSLTRQLHANTEIVRSFEDTLRTMQSRIYELTDSSDQKETELSQLRSLLTQLKEHQVALQSNVNLATRVSTQPDLLTDAVSIQDASMSLRDRDYLAGSNSRLSMGSVHSLASTAHTESEHLQRSDGKSKHKRGWLMASFGKAFNKRKSNMSTTDAMSVQSLQVDPFYMNISSPGNSSSALHSSASGTATSPTYVNTALPEVHVVQANDLHLDGQGYQNGRAEDSLSNADSVDNDVEYLKSQLKEKELKLTDAQLEALTTTHQLEHLKQMMMRMKVEMQSLKTENERLNGVIGSNVRKLGDNADLLTTGSSRTCELADDNLTIPCVDLSASNERCCITVCVAMVRLPDSPNSQEATMVGNVLIDPRTSWYELDAAISSLFCSYVQLLDSVAIRLPPSQKLVAQGAPKLGLSESSIRAYTFGSIQRELEDGVTPTATPYQSASDCRVVRIQLRGWRLIMNANRQAATSTQDTVEEENYPLDQLVFETLIPRSVLERYLTLLTEYKRLIFSGPPGTGKTFLAKRLAELLSLKMKEPDSVTSGFKPMVDSPMSGNARTVAPTGLGAGVTCFVVDQKSHKELRQYLTHVTDKCLLQLGTGATTPQTPTTPTDPLHPSAHSPVTLPQILLLDNLHQLAHNVSEVLRNVATVPQQAGFYVLGTMHNATSLPGAAGSTTAALPNGQSVANANQYLATCLEIHHDFRWIICGNHLEPTRSLLNRYLRRKLVDTELRHRQQLTEDSQQNVLIERWRLLSAIQRWTVQLWFTLNRLLETSCCADLTVGPKIFFACPFDDPRNAQSWFTDLWNYSIFPYLLNAARDTNISKNKSNGESDASSIADEAFNWICQTYPWPTNGDFGFLMRLRSNTQDEFNVDSVVNTQHNSDGNFEALA